MGNPLPSLTAPIVDGNGKLKKEWARVFTDMQAQPGGIDALAPKRSPFAYTAGSNGSLHVTGGTVSKIALTRAQTTVTLGSTSGVFPMAAGDVVTVTYTVAPTMNFIPS